jgi:hypothetical protein
MATKYSTHLNLVKPYSGQQGVAGALNNNTDIIDGSINALNVNVAGINSDVAEIKEQIKDLSNGNDGTPSQHFHPFSEIRNTNPVLTLQQALDAKADTNHKHTITNVNNLQSELNNRSLTNHHHDGRYAQLHHAELHNTQFNQITQNTARITAIEDFMDQIVHANDINISVAMTNTGAILTLQTAQDLPIKQWALEVRLNSNNTILRARHNVPETTTIWTLPTMFTPNPPVSPWLLIPGESTILIRVWLTTTNSSASATYLINNWPALDGGGGHNNPAMSPNPCCDELKEKVMTMQGIIDTELTLDNIADYITSHPEALNRLANRLSHSLSLAENVARVKNGQNN